MEKTNIEWCDSTFNPWIGCTKVGPGCDNCYAEAMMDGRLKQVNWGSGQSRRKTSSNNWKLPKQWNKKKFLECQGCGWRGDKPDTGRQGGLTHGIESCPLCDGFELVPARRRVFCASLADVFDNEAPIEWRADLFALISNTPSLDWLLLTKRIGNVRNMVPLPWLTKWPPNVWMGATVVNQDEAQRDIPKLLNVPAKIRFLSIEPILGEIDLTKIERTQSPGYFGDCLQWYHRPFSDRYNKWQGIDWVIVGGESGPRARPMHPSWVRSLRDQCVAADVPFLFKQWGEFAPNWFNDDSGQKIPDSEWIDRIGKRNAGRQLDGCTWNQFPGNERKSK